MYRAAPFSIITLAMGGDGRKFLEAGIAVFVELWIFLVAFLEKHTSLLPIR